MLKLSSITKYYGSRAVLDGADFHFSRGTKYTIFGPNGSGKSTLLGILTGATTPDEGEVVKPKDCAVGYLRQEPNPEPADDLVLEVVRAHGPLARLEQRMQATLDVLNSQHDDKSLMAFEDAERSYREAGGYELPSQARSLLAGLGFTEKMMSQHPTSLSGGWRMRVELARTLIAKPDVLVLDEPTNHLDLPALVWFENWLKSYAGTLIFVSHDKKLLDWLPDSLLHLRGGRLYAYAGGYTKFLETRELEQSQAEARFDNLERKRKQLDRFVERFGAKATKAAQAQSKRKMIAKIEAEQAAIEQPAAESKLSVTLREPPRNHRIVCTAKELEIGYDRSLALPLDLVVENGQKIAIVGANGMGKSTLLKTLAGEIAPIDGSFEFSSVSKVSYFAQHQLEVFVANRSVLDNVCTATGLSEPLARKALGTFLFSGDDVFKEFGVLSGGEKSRVGLCCLFQSGANVLLLDEPTNHLDLASVDALLSVIRSYKGTLMMVSHDRHLIESTCDRMLVLAREEFTPSDSITSDWQSCFEAG